MSKDDIAAIIAVCLIIGGLTCALGWAADNCQQKRCPEGMSPTFMVHDGVCVCVVQPK